MIDKHDEARGGLTLVVGSSGKTGRRVVQRLAARGVPTRLGSRRAEIPFDWEDESTWAPALEGVQAAYVAFHPDLAVPGAPDAIRTFTETAVEAGLKRLVLLSGRGEVEAQRCERIVQESSLDWTIVRASWFFQNFSEGFLRDMIVGGTVALPVGDVLEPFIDAEDIADVAVAALLEPGHEGQLYEVTGPRLMTFADAVHEIELHAKGGIRFVSIDHDAFRTSMLDEGVPEDYIKLVDYLFTEVLDGRNASTTSGVQRALGRDPLDFRHYVQSAADSGAWSVEVAR